MLFRCRWTISLPGLEVGRHQSKERLVLQVSLNARYDRFRQLLDVQNLGNKTRALNSQVWRNPLNLFRGAEYLRFQVRFHLILCVWAFGRSGARKGAFIFGIAGSHKEGASHLLRHESLCTGEFFEGGSYPGLHLFSISGPSNILYVWGRCWLVVLKFDFWRICHSGKPKYDMMTFQENQNTK